MISVSSAANNPAPPLSLFFARNRLRGEPDVQSAMTGSVTRLNA